MAITKVKVKLIGGDGNAFFVLGKVRAEMKKACVPKEIIDEYIKEATSGDYDNLLCTTCKYVEVV